MKDNRKKALMRAIAEAASRFLDHVVDAAIEVMLEWARARRQRADRHRPKT